MALRNTDMCAHSDTLICECRATPEQLGMPVTTEAQNPPNVAQQCQLEFRGREWVYLYELFYMPVIYLGSLQSMLVQVSIITHSNPVY